ncbi:MAG: S53 family peptidase [Candidatus Velthaea sp.]
MVEGSDKTLDPRTTLLKPVDPQARIDVTVRLRPDHAIPEGYTGETRDRFEQQHGTRPGDVAKVTAFARDYGLEVRGISNIQRTIGLSGTAAQMHAAFGVDLAEYRTPEETFRGRVGTITVPENIAGAVGGVFGLDDRSTSKSHMVPAATANPAHGFTPLEVAKAYHFPPGDGSGEHVAVISLGGRYDDVAQQAYCKRLGVPHVPFHVVNVDGGADNARDAGPTGENTLDAQIIGTVVPNADKTMYIAPNTDRGFLDAISTAMHDKHHNSAISISWGGPEERFTPQAMRAFNELFKEARAMGVNVFCAAGDNGSSDGVGDGNDHVDFPSSSPSVIANGGTKLMTGADGTIAKETVWNELRYHEGATGGGISAHNPKPSVQSGLNISGRGVPDIAGDADPTTGFEILVPTAAHGKSALTLIGGTSAVAPLYAALAARLEQNLAHPLGDLQRAIYGAPQKDFNDITAGNNGSFKAAPGWDAVTGRGSIDGEALLAYLRANTPVAKFA